MTSLKINNCNFHRKRCKNRLGGARQDLNKTAKTSILIIVGDPYGMRAKSPNKAVIRGDLSFFKSASSVTNQSYNKKGADATAWIKKKGYPAPAGFGSTGKGVNENRPCRLFYTPFLLAICCKFRYDVCVYS